MKAIKSQVYRTVCQSLDGNLCVDHLCYTEDFVEMNGLNRIHIEKFECTDDAILILDDNYNLYKVVIDTDGWVIPTMININILANPSQSGLRTKSANKCKIRSIKHIIFIFAVIKY